MAKTLQQIKDEHAKELGYADYEDLFLEGVHTGIQACCDFIAIKYANQKLEEAADIANLKREWTNTFTGKVEETETVDGCNLGAYRYTVNKKSILNLREEL